MSGPQRIGDVLSRELARFGPAAGMTEIVRAWPEAVGEQIARNAWPARLARNGTLHVATSSSAWAFELMQLESKLLGRLREPLGDALPSGLRFAPGKLPEPSLEPDRTRRETSPEPTPAERAIADRLAAGISDESLREIVAKAAAASLARHP